MKRVDRMSNDARAIAGNNAFSLTTTLDDDGEIELIGILKDMPSFGLSTEWSEAPKATFGKKLQEFFMGDAIVTAGYLFGAELNSQVLSDDWSTRMYAGTKNKSISLNFRLYPQNLLGQSTPDIWIYNLARYATLGSNSTLDIDILMENIKKVVYAAEEKGEKVSQFANVIAGAKQKDDTDQAKKERRTAMANVINNIPKLLTEAKKEVRQEMIDTREKNGNNSYTQEINKKDVTKSVTEILNKCDVQLSPGSRTYVDKYHVNNLNIDDEEMICFKFTWLDTDYLWRSTESEVVDDCTLDTSTMHIRVNDILDGLEKQNSKWKNAYAKDLTKEFYEKVLNYIDKKLGEKNLTRQTPLEALDTKSPDGIVATLENEIASQFRSEDRWKQKFLAARLWKLNIFPFIFKKPIIVAITDWKVTPSLEMMDGMHAYYDFSITCEPDQVKSLNRWKYVLNNDESQSGGTGVT